MPPLKLSEQAEEFRRELEASLRAFTGKPFQLAASDSADGSLIWIKTPRESDSTPVLVPLQVANEDQEDTLLGIELEYQCLLSETHRYLTVRSSSIKVWPLATTRGEPLLWKPRLRQARTTWRQTQLKAAIRDSPALAAEILNEMYGFEISLPEEALDRSDRLTKS